MRGGLFFDHIFRDLSYAVRTLRKSPGFTLTATITLALGIGATTAMFSVLNGVLLRPLPFRDPDRLVLIRERLPKLRSEPISIPASDVVTFSRESSSFDGVAGFITENYDLTLGDMPRKVSIARVQWNLFPLLGVQPAIGRDFTPEEDHPESYLAIVSDGFWKREFGGSPDVLGKTVMLNRKPYQVIGVMPAEFEFPLLTDELTEIWVPMGFTPAEIKIGATSFAYGALARLKPGVSLAQARADVERVTKDIAKNFPAVQRGDLTIFGTVVSFIDDSTKDFRRPLLVLFLAVLLVLLIAVVNVAGLLLARGTARQRELAIRIALGAGARRVLMQLLVESIVLGVTGGLAGLLLTAAATRTLLAMVPSRIPRMQSVTVDGPVLAFAIGLSVVAALAFGAAPALLALRTNVNENLNEGGRGASPGRQRQRLRAGLVVVQLALALMLLTGAGLLLRSFRHLLELDPGFRPENVITASVSLSPRQYSDGPPTNTFFTELNRRLAQIPGARFAALGTDLPLETKRESALTVDGYTPPPGGSGLNAFSFVLGNYFQTMGIPLVRGRLLTDSDDDPNASKVVVINQELAKKFFAGRDPIGGRLKLGASGGTAPWWTVVGVVGDVRPLGLDGDMLPHTYMPYLQHLPDQLKGGAAQNMVIAVRTVGDPASAASFMRSAVWSLDRQVPVTDVRTMEQVVSQSTAPRRFNMVLVGFFAGAALLLAAVGLYGLMSYSVSQRTHEIGVRMALGARRIDVLRMVLGSGFTLVCIGLAAGFCGAIAASRLLTSFLFEVRAYDPLTLVAVSVILAAVALLASLVPALRATQIDAMTALRGE